MMERVLFSRSDKEQHRSILRLLCEAFGHQYLHYYELHLEALASADSTILLADKGEIVAHIQVVSYDAKLSSSLGLRRCAYLYAICTAESHRGAGIMTKLMRDLFNGELRAKGYDFAILVPADTDLIAYYERLDMRLMSGSIFMKAPKEAYPVIRPGLDAECYMDSAAELDAQFEELTYSKGSSCRFPQKWVPFTPKQVGWMSYPLAKDIMPEDTMLVNPLT